MKVLICKPSSFIKDELNEYFRGCNWEADFAIESGAIYHSLSRKEYDFALYYVSCLDDFAVIRYINENYPEIQVLITSDASLEANIENVRKGDFTALKLPNHLAQLQELFPSIPSVLAQGSVQLK